MGKFTDTYLEALREDLINIEHKLNTKDNSLINICNAIDNNELTMSLARCRLQVFFNKLAFKSRRKHGHSLILQSTVDKTDDKIVYYYTLSNDVYKLSDKDMNNPIKSREDKLKEIIDYRLKEIELDKKSCSISAFVINNRLYFAMIHKDDINNTVVIDTQYCDKNDRKDIVVGYTYNYTISLTDYKIVDQGFEKVICDSDCDISRTYKDFPKRINDKFNECVKCTKFSGIEQSDKILDAYIKLTLELMKKEKELELNPGELNRKLISNKFEDGAITFADIRNFNETPINIVNTKSKKKENSKLDKILSDFDTDFDI